MSFEFTPQEIDAWKLKRDYQELDKDQFKWVWPTMPVMLPEKRAGYDTIRGGYKRKTMLELH